MKKIYLVGDACIDQLLYEQPFISPKGEQEQVLNCETHQFTKLFTLSAGVLLLKEFLSRAFSNTDTKLLSYGELSTDQIHSGEIIQSIATVKRFDSKQELRGKPVTVFVDKFHGFSGISGKNKKRLIINESSANSDLVIIDDAGNGMREEDCSWIDELGKKNNEFVVIHKINFPFRENKLLEKLTSRFDTKLITIIQADDLRQFGLKISRQLSWDKTLEEFCQSFFSHPGLKPIRKSRAVIIRFGLEACICVSRNMVPDFRDERDFYDSRLYYSAYKYEGQISEEASGNMQGMTYAFMATFAEKLLHHEGKLDIQSENLVPLISNSIIPAMEAAIRCRLKGYTISDNGLTISYPFDQILKDKNKEKENAYSIRVADLNRVMNQEKPSLLGHFSFDNRQLIELVAFDYVKEKKSSFLDNIPLARFNDFITYDREEIESFRGFKKLVTEYLKSGKKEKPLSVGVFGPPGSGKSFGVKQIAASFKGLEIIETNISQLHTYDDLIRIFHDTRDVNLSGKIPLVFFDEFDSSFEDKPLGWLKFFLAPMQDGHFKDGEKMHPIGKAVFVFAGGTSNSFKDFTAPLGGGDSDTVKKNNNLSSEYLKSIKAPDFVSRLKGFIDIKGINETAPDDRLYPIRRALTLRNQLESYPNLIDINNRIYIDDNLLNAFLRIKKFEYGSRSMESIIKMSDLKQERSFKKSNLPSEKLLSLHVNVEDFNEKMQASLIFPPDQIEIIAKEIHNRWLKKEIEKKSTKPTVVVWEKLDDSTRDSNREQAKDIVRKLDKINYKIVESKDINMRPVKFTQAEIGVMAEMEHERWNREKMAQGWVYGKERNDDLKIHDNILPWEELVENIKLYDVDAVKGIPDVLKEVGLWLVKKS